MPKGNYPDFKKDGKTPHPAAGLSMNKYDAKGNLRPQRKSRAKDPERFTKIAEKRGADIEQIQKAKEEVSKKLVGVKDTKEAEKVAEFFKEGGSKPDQLPIRPRKHFYETYGWTDEDLSEFFDAKFTEEEVLEKMGMVEELRKDVFGAKGLYGRYPDGAPPINLAHLAMEHMGFARQGRKVDYSHMLKVARAKNISIKQAKIYKIKKKGDVAYYGGKEDSEGAESRSDNSMGIQLKGMFNESGEIDAIRGRHDIGDYRCCNGFVEEKYYHRVNITPYLTTQPDAYKGANRIWTNPYRSPLQKPMSWAEWADQQNERYGKEEDWLRIPRRYFKSWTQFKNMFIRNQFDGRYFPTPIHYEIGIAGSGGAKVHLPRVVKGKGEEVKRSYVFQGDAPVVSAKTAGKQEWFYHDSPLGGGDADSYWKAHKKDIKDWFDRTYDYNSGGNKDKSGNLKNPIWERGQKEKISDIAPDRPILPQAEDYGYKTEWVGEEGAEVLTGGWTDAKRNRDYEKALSKAEKEQKDWDNQYILRQQVDASQFPAPRTATRWGELRKGEGRTYLNRMVRDDFVEAFGLELEDTDGSMALGSFVPPEGERIRLLGTMADADGGDKSWDEQSRDIMLTALARYKLLDPRYRFEVAPIVIRGTHDELEDAEEEAIELEQIELGIQYSSELEAGVVMTADQRREYLETRGETVGSFRYVHGVKVRKEVQETIDKSKDFLTKSGKVRKRAPKTRKKPPTPVPEDDEASLSETTSDEAEEGVAGVQQEAGEAGWKFTEPRGQLRYSNYSRTGEEIAEHQEAYTVAPEEMANLQRDVVIDPFRSAAQQAQEDAMSFLADIGGTNYVDRLQETIDIAPTGGFLPPDPAPPQLDVDPEITTTINDITDAHPPPPDPIGVGQETYSVQDWIEQSGYLKGYVVKPTSANRFNTLEEAKAECIRLINCGGITKEITRGKTYFSTRKGRTTVPNVGNRTEQSWIKPI